MKKNILISIACLIFFLLVTAVPSEAATGNNDIARNLLSEYYSPEDCLDTCVYNIDNCYTQQTYSDKDLQDDIYAEAEKITSAAKTDKEKVRLIHDWMCQNIDYAEDTSGYNGYPYSVLANPYTVYKNKKAVCYGFSNLTEMMLQHVGVPCVIVRGNSSSHVWNAVYIDNKWIFTDNTWDENLTTESKVSYRYYLMSDETYDNSYRTEYIENWAGDACYFPVYVTSSYPYHSILLNSKGGKCRKKIPFSENMDKFVIPVPDREGRTFSRWTNDHDIDGYYYAGFGGWYLSGGIKGTKEDIAFTAQYTKVNPEYEIPENVVGYEGNSLSEVALPSGFEWVDGSETLTETKTFKANYIPEDTDDYNIVRNIDIQVRVVPVSEKIFSDAKETNSRVQEELGIAGQFRSEVTAMVKTLDSLKASEDTSINSTLSSLNDTLEYQRKVSAAASESVSKIEELLKSSSLSSPEVKAAISAAEKNIAELEAQTAVTKRELEKAGMNFPDANSMWSGQDVDEEISILQKHLLDINSAISGTEQAIQKYGETEESARLLDTLRDSKELLEKELETFSQNKLAAEKTISDIIRKRESLKTLSDTISTELTAAGLQDIKSRLAEISDIAGASISVSPASFTYNGKTKHPKVTVSGLTANKDYTVSYSNNKKAGKGIVTVTGKGVYTGTVTKTFSIKAPKPKIVKLSKYRKTACSIKIKKLSGVTKYQVAYKASGEKKWKYRTISTGKNTIRLTKLKRKTKYKIKVRAVCPGNNGKVYSAWSNTKAIRR